MRTVPASGAAWITGASRWGRSAAAARESAGCAPAGAAAKTGPRLRSQAATSRRMRIPIARVRGVGCQTYARERAMVSSGWPDEPSDGSGRRLVGTGTRGRSAWGGRERFLLDDPPDGIGAGADAADPLQLRHFLDRL